MSNANCCWSHRHARVPPPSSLPAVRQLCYSHAVKSSVSATFLNRNLQKKRDKSDSLVPSKHHTGDSLKNTKRRMLLPAANVFMCGRWCSNLLQTVLSDNQDSIYLAVHGPCLIAGQVKRVVRPTSTGGFGHIRPLHLWSATDHEPHCRPVFFLTKLEGSLQSLHDAGDDAVYQ